MFGVAETELLFVVCAVLKLCPAVFTVTLYANWWHYSWDFSVTEFQIWPYE